MQIQPVSSKTAFRYLIQTESTFSSKQSMYKSVYDKYESLVSLPNKSLPQNDTSLSIGIFSLYIDYMV
jgi:hypothetical protein